MSVTYTKLFSSITESTVWCEPDETRLVWITMLAMADWNGRIWASIPGLANRARVSVEGCQKAIETFLAPDRFSRTSDYEGRRIETIDGGWRLLNYEKYRSMRDQEERKRYQREWDRSKRKRNPIKSDHSRPQPTYAEAEAEAEAEKKEKTIAHRDAREGFALFWKAYPKKKAKGDAEKVWNTLKPTNDLTQVILAAIERAKASADWTKDGGQFIPFPATWLRRKGWEDEEFTPLTPADPYADNPLGMYADWPSPPAEDFCIHGWGLTPELRVKHGDRADQECGQCQADARKAAEKAGVG